MLIEESAPIVGRSSVSIRAMETRTCPLCGLEAAEAHLEAHAPAAHGLTIDEAAAKVDDADAHDCGHHHPAVISRLFGAPSLELPGQAMRRGGYL